MNTPIFSSENDIKLHLCALIRIANADGNFCDREKALVNSTIGAYCTIFPSLSAEELLAVEFSDNDFDAALERLKAAPLQARLLIKDLVTLGYIDDDYCDAERKMVAEFGTKLGIPMAIIHELEELTMDYLHTMKKLNNMIWGTSKEGSFSCVNDE